MQPQSLPKRLVTVTHFLRAAILDGQTSEANSLAAERGRLIEQLSHSGHELSPNEQEAIRTSDEMVRAAAETRRTDLSKRLRQVNSVRKLRSTYR